jgi:aryl-phospho-beta-D-glucosidase BglC (GH1 family)
MKTVLIVLLTIASLQLKAQPSVHEVNAAMGRGINLGNTLEPPTEGGWNNDPVQEYYFDDYKAAGFTCVRVPIRWDNYTSKTAPYTVTKAWMDRIEQVIDWGLERDLYIVMNTHHDDWIKTGYDLQSNRDRFDSIWSQIAVRFQHKSEKLLFEMINEPHGLTLANVNEINARVLSIIRKTNPTRIVLFSGHMWSNSAELMAADIPDDPYLIGYFHSYDPWSFAGEANGTWGTAADRSSLKNKFAQVKAWSEKNNIPVTLNEFGAISQFRTGGTTRLNDYNSRMRHYAAYVEEALNHNFSFNAWDDGGDFRIYQRAQRNWNDIKDILMYTSSKTPDNLQLTIKRDTILRLTWNNRDESIDSIFIERKTDNNSFTKIASLPANQQEYDDWGLELEKPYYYRVVYHYSDGIDTPSYPITSKLIPYIRSPFLGEPHKIPGIIEAEDYDIGGQELTYNDTDTQNKGNAYRTTEGVDIQSRTNGYHVSHVEAGEWIEYTVDVEEAGTYEITAWVASVGGGGRMGLMFDGGQTTSFNIPATGNATKFEGVTATRKLNAGTQVMRLRIVSLPAFNIDRIEFARGTSSGLLDQPQSGLAVYSSHQATISIESNIKGQITFFDIKGRLITKEKLEDAYHEFSLPANQLVMYQMIDDKGKAYSGKVRVR